MPSGEELTMEKIGAYEFALEKVSDAALATGLKRCMQECEFFPTTAEIRERCVVPGAIEAAYERFTQRQLSAPKQKLIRSVLDDPAVRQEVIALMPRHARIAAGIEPPSEIDVAARIEELRRQAEKLGAKDPVRETAGLGEGL